MPLSRTCIDAAAHALAEHLRVAGVVPEQTDTARSGPWSAAPYTGPAVKQNRAGHVLWMLEQIPSMSDLSKAERWLCFAQGVLWAHGDVSVDECRKLNSNSGQ